MLKVFLSVNKHTFKNLVRYTSARAFLSWGRSRLSRNALHYLIDEMKWSQPEKPETFCDVSDIIMGLRNSDFWKKDSKNFLRVLVSNLCTSWLFYCIHIFIERSLLDSNQNSGFFSLVANQWPFEFIKLEITKRKVIFLRVVKKINKIKQA